MSRGCNYIQLIGPTGPFVSRHRGRIVKRTVWLPVTALIVVGVVVSSLLPAGTAGPVPTGTVDLGLLGLIVGADKLVHALGYAAITVTAARLTENRLGLVAVAFFAVALGAGTELGHEPDRDGLADGEDLLVGLRLSRRRRGRRGGGDGPRALARYRVNRVPERSRFRRASASIRQ